MSSYYDTLLDNAFGNFRALLKAVTLHPGMGIYLNMQGNDAGSIVTGLHANENYAREIKQLFSIGLNRMWPDGTLVMNSQGSLVPTYNQNVVSGFASAFTGWNYYQTNQANGRLPSNWYPRANYTNPMVLVPTHHELGTKLLLDNVMLPPAWGNAGFIPRNANFDAYCSQDLEQAMDSIYNNQNVGPFICRQLIQRLVTSNPSRNYRLSRRAGIQQQRHRRARQFAGGRQAILLDYEARSTQPAAPQPTYGKQREPLLRVTGARPRASRAGRRTAALTPKAARRPSPSPRRVPHRLNTGDTVALTFTDTSGQSRAGQRRITP